MQATKINSYELQLFKSILEMFNGTAQFVIENPWFNFKTMIKKKSKDQFMAEFREVNTKYGKLEYLTCPRILIRKSDESYTMFYDIKWTNESGKKKY